MHLDERFAAARLRLGKSVNLRTSVSPYFSKTTAFILSFDPLAIHLQSTCNPLAIHRCRVALADACQRLEFCIPKTLVFNSRATQPSNNPN